MKKINNKINLGSQYTDPIKVNGKILKQGTGAEIQANKADFIYKSSYRNNSQITIREIAYTPNFGFTEDRQLKRNGKKYSYNTTVLTERDRDIEVEKLRSDGYHYIIVTTGKWRGFDVYRVWRVYEHYYDVKMFYRLKNIKINNKTFIVRKKHRYHLKKGEKPHYKFQHGNKVYHVRANSITEAKDIIKNK